MKHRVVIFGSGASSAPPSLHVASESSISPAHAAFFVADESYSDRLLNVSFLFRTCFDES